MMRNGLDPGGASASASRMRPSREAIDMEDVNAGNTPNHLAGKGKKMVERPAIARRQPTKGKAAMNTPQEDGDRMCTLSSSS